MILLALVVIALIAVIAAIPMGLLALPLAAAIWCGAWLAGVMIPFLTVWGVITAALVLLCPWSFD